MPGLQTCHLHQCMFGAGLSISPTASRRFVTLCNRRFYAVVSSWSAASAVRTNMNPPMMAMGTTATRAVTAPSHSDMAILSILRRTKRPSGQQGRRSFASAGAAMCQQPLRLRPLQVLVGRPPGAFPSPAPLEMSSPSSSPVSAGGSGSSNRPLPISAAAGADSNIAVSADVANKAPKRNRRVIVLGRFRSGRSRLRRWDRLELIRLPFLLGGPAGRDMAHDAVELDVIQTATTRRGVCCAMTSKSRSQWRTGMSSRMATAAITASN